MGTQLLDGDASLPACKRHRRAAGARDSSLSPQEGCLAIRGRPWAGSGKLPDQSAHLRSDQFATFFHLRVGNRFDDRHVRSGTGWDDFCGGRGSVGAILPLPGLHSVSFAPRHGSVTYNVLNVDVYHSGEQRFAGQRSQPSLDFAYVAGDVVAAGRHRWSSDLATQPVLLVDNHRLCGVGSGGRAA